MFRRRGGHVAGRASVSRNALATGVPGGQPAERPGRDARRARVQRADHAAALPGVPFGRSGRPVAWWSVHGAAVSVARTPGAGADRRPSEGEAVPERAHRGHQKDVHEIRAGQGLQPADGTIHVARVVRPSRR